MIKCHLNKDFLAEAYERSKKMKVLFNSRRGTNGNYVGLLGEMVIENWFNKSGINFMTDYETTHDLRISQDNRTIDVKTKERSVPPQENYGCSTPLYNKEKQIPDYYLYVSLERHKGSDKKDPFRFHTAYILGAANQYIMHKKGLIWRKDQVDPANGTKFWTDCLNVLVRDLVSPTDTLTSFRECKPEVKVYTKKLLHDLKTKGQMAICKTGFQRNLERVD